MRRRGCALRRTPAVRSVSVVTVIAIVVTIALSVLTSAEFSATAQEKDKTAPQKIAIRAGRLIDAKGEAPIANALILIEGDHIVSITAAGSAPAGVQLIDLSQATVLPGFVDTHSHSYQGILRNILANGRVDPDYNRDIVGKLTPAFTPAARNAPARRATRLPNSA